MELTNNKFKQTEIGLILEDWDLSLISECAKKITDGEHLTPIRAESGYYLLSARNIRNGKVDTSDVDYVGKEEYKRIRKRCNPEYGDVLISCSGSIGRVAIVPENFECVLVRSAALIKPDNFKTVSLYIQYFLQSSLGQKQIFTSMNQGAQPNLFLNHIQNLKIVLPPQPEQKAIAQVLSDTDNLIQAIEQKLTKKRAIKQGAMQQLLTPKDEWEVKKLGEICDRITTGKLDANAMVKDGEYRFYTCAKQYYFIDNYAFDTEALLVSGNGANVGYIHYYKGKFNAYQRTYVLNGFSENIFYIKLFMDKFLKVRIDEQKNDGNTPYIKMDTLYDMIIHIPNPEEQTQISTILSDMNKEIAQLEQKLSKYKMLKQGLMQNLLTGKIRLV